MARAPARPKPVANPLEEEANDRHRDARQKKSWRLTDYRECYFFAAPNRQRQLTSSLTESSSRPTLDASELNTDIASILVDDFITEIINTYMPDAQQWCERGRGEGVPEDAYKQVAEQVKNDDKTIFEAMKTSNLYAALPIAANPDLAIAGCGIIIRRPRAHEPIEVIAVPMREIEVNLGANGEIDDRFITRPVRNRQVHAVLGKEIADKLPKEITDELDGKGKSDKRTLITWGYWRLWDREDDVAYQYVVMVGEKLVHDAVQVGEGACEFIFMRFKATADWSWAVGPLMQGLPTLRQVDELERMKIEAVERAVNPAITYPDDSIAAVEQGIEPGMAYPLRPGQHARDAVGPIYEQPTIQPEIYQIETMEKRLRKIFYVDHPEQSGDTPPTLGQWLDELARAQRRIGTPGQAFWREGPRAIFLRFKYLLQQSGAIGKLETKEGKAISTRPYNPAQRAAEQQEIATAFQCAQALAQMFPEEWRVWIDGNASMDALIAKMRTGGLLKKRAENDVKAALGQIQQLLGSGGIHQQAGAPVPQGAGAPAAA